MRQRPAKPVQLPNHQAVVRSQERQRFRKAGAIAPAAAGMILKQVALIHAGSQERIALKIQHLPIAVRWRRAYSRSAWAENPIRAVSVQ